MSESIRRVAYIARLGTGHGAQLLADACALGNPHAVTRPEVIMAFIHRLAQSLLEICGFRMLRR